jgi:hypothetical protein
VLELKREFGSHLNADINGWDYAAGYGEVMSGIHASAFLNANRDTKLHPKPIVLPMPWPNETAVEDVTPEERAKLRASLLRRSAFAS